MLGLFYFVTRDGESAGITCVTVDGNQGPTREQVLQRFKELQWPSSSVVVQPVGGQTLVNLETIFSTTNNEPTAKTVTIAKKDVQIIATPVSYLWNFGDGTTLNTTLTTGGAGRPYPARDITHVYAATDEVQVSVATTYTGSYTIGDGKPQDLPEPLTVPGPELTLGVLEAKPQLVLR